MDAPGKLHKRSMPLRELKENSNIPEVISDLKNSSRHGKYLENVPSDQMEKLVKMIQDKMKGFDPRPPTNQQLDLDEDMNKLDDMELNKRKALMNEEFEANRVKPGDQEFLYDKEVEFVAGKMESGWDDDEDYSDPEF